MNPRRIQFSRFAEAVLILWAGTPRRGIRIARRAFPARKTACFLSAAIALLAGSWPAAAAENAPPASMRTVARVHWLGMKRLTGETNAAPWMGVWKLPESGKLERQTLDKLSLAPWPLLHRGTDTNAAALLRPLLDDVVAEESYTEIRRAPDLPDQMVFIIHLDRQRAALWQTNLARVVESLTGLRPVPAPDGQYGWSLRKHHSPNVIELTRVGGWTIVGAADIFNGLIAELRARFQRNLLPWNPRSNNDWLEADLHPSQIIPGLTNLNSQLSTVNRLYLSVTGDGANVLSRGTVDFVQPLSLDLKPWNIPTNLIDTHLSSITFVRGFQPWLASSSSWTNLQIGLPPDQACLWGIWGIPSQTYFTAPLSEAGHEVDRFTDWVLQNQKHWFATNGLAGFERSRASNGLDWKGLPYMSPFLCSFATNHQSFIYGGGFPNPPIQPVSLYSAQTALSQTNLVYHDWEMTGQRIDQWIYMGQFARLIFHKAQLPSGSPGLAWLQAIEPKLGLSLTDVIQTGPGQLSFTRKSGLGLTGVELNLLADWLESPQFPSGLHTFTAPPDKLPP